MSDLATITKEAEALAGHIKAVKRATEDHGGRLDKLDLVVSDITATQQRLTQAVDAANRAAFDQQLEGNHDHELAYYRPEPHDLENVETKRCYVGEKTGHGRAIRLVGHERMADPRNPRSKVRVHGLFDDPNPRTPWQRQAQRLLDRRNLIARHLNAGAPASETERLRAWQCEADLIDHLRTGPDYARRIFTDSAGVGAEWLPDTPLPELEREIMFRPSAWQMYQQVQMSKGQLVRPRRTGYLTAYKGVIPLTDDPAGDPLLTGFATSQQVIEAAEVAVGAQIWRNAEEDALISFEGEIRADMVDATVFAIENARTNGDSAASHQDAIASWNVRGRLAGSVLGGANSQLRLWRGLRALAYDLTSMTTDGGGSAVTAAHLLADLNAIKAESLLTSEGRVGVVIEVSPETFFGGLVTLAEFDAFDNVGLLASVITGQLGDVGRTPGGLLPGQVGFLYGRFPVLINYLLTKDLAATGLFTNTGALTGKLTHDASRFQFFIRRGALVEMVDDIRNNTRTLVSRTRMNFVPRDPDGSTTKTCHWRFNIP